MTDISKLKQLIHLKIATNDGLNQSSHFEALKLLLDNCLHLKSISFHVRCVPFIHSVNKQFWIQLNRLKRLSLWSTDFHVSDIFTFELFEGFNQLTHLAVVSPDHYYSQPVCDTILIGIDRNLPKLKNLTIGLRLKASKWSAEILSRISTLETITIFTTNKSGADHIKAKLSQHPNIRSMQVLSSQELGRVSINTRVLFHY